MKNNCTKFESTKTRSWKRALCISKYVVTRLAHALATATFFNEKIRVIWLPINHLIEESTARAAQKGNCNPGRVLVYG
jgi:hypothetical protein